MGQNKGTFHIEHARASLSRSKLANSVKIARMMMKNLMNVWIANNLAHAQRTFRCYEIDGGNFFFNLCALIFS
jgi:hypothetical protein